MDRQLRGRSGRQGDPGSSIFYVSLEDDLMRIFGSERISSLVDRMGMAENEALEASMLSGAIERAQRKVEENDFGTRKRLVDYDDVMNNQREVVYTKRRNALTGERIDVDVLNMTTDYCEMFVEQNKDLDYDSFCEELRQTLSVEPDFDEKFFEKSNRAQLTEALQQSLLSVQQRRFDALVERAWPIIKYVYETKRMFYQNIAIPVSDGKQVYTILVDLKKAYESKGREVIRAVEKTVTLRVIDEYWKNHLRDMDDLKQSVQNAAYEQKDPIVVYKTESYDLFITMLENLNKDVLAFLLRAQIYLRQEQQPEDVVTEGHEKRSDLSRMQTSRPDLLTNSSEPKTNAPIHVEKRVGRNDPCPCGSGKKFKNCHGREV